MLQLVLLELFEWLAQVILRCMRALAVTTGLFEKDSSNIFMLVLFWVVISAGFQHGTAISYYRSSSVRHDGCSCSLAQGVAAAA
jgi:hypothetical protein